MKTKRVLVAMLMLTVMVAAPSAAVANGMPPPESQTTLQGLVWEKVLSPEDLVGNEVAEKYGDLRIHALAIDDQRWVAALSSAHTTSRFPQFYEPIYHLLGVWLSDNSGMSWQKLPNPNLANPVAAAAAHLTWVGQEAITVFFFPGGLQVFNEQTLVWTRLMGVFDYLKLEIGQDHTGQNGRFVFIVRNDPAYPVTYETRHLAEDPRDVPPAETDGLYLCWNRGEVKLLLPTKAAQGPAYVSIAQVIRTKNATQLYVRVDEGPSRYLLGDIWRVTIPDQILQNPEALLRTTLTLRIGSKNLIVERGGERTVIVLDAVPEIPTGTSRTFLPIRPVVEALGGEIFWFGEDRRVEIQSGDRKIVLWIGRNIAVVDGVEMPIDAANPDVRPYIAPPGRTMLPLRFIAEALGAEVGWDGPTRTVTITYPGSQGTAMP